MPEVLRLTNKLEALFQELDELPLSRKVQALNLIRQRLHEHSPFIDELVDNVQWVANDAVEANDYNPNTVAPPEMKLLTRSIDADGFTQPIVAHADPSGGYVVVDGYHRQKVGRSTRIAKRLHGFLPIVAIRGTRGLTSDRIAATIRHNRARGVHAIPPMTEIVVGLLEHGWSEADIGRELGMDEEEITRFKQISGLPGLFRNHDYSQSWE